jgi:phage-related protein
VRQVMGYALYLAQLGDKHLDAKPLKGFAGAGVLEIVADHDGDAFRAVYTVRFADAVYALHAFQKKSTRGIATPKREIERIWQRLRQAQAHYEGWRRQPRGDQA